MKTKIKKIIFFLGFLLLLIGAGLWYNSYQPYEDQIKVLSPLQYYVTQLSGTEPAFQNKYWDHAEKGVYVDIVSGEALFSSEDKFESKSGWPSFTNPIEDGSIQAKEDTSHGMERVEIAGKNSKSHLGHLFNDGPTEKGGKRYCVNSAALDFIPFEKLEELGYGDLVDQFKHKPEVTIFKTDVPVSE